MKTLKNKKNKAGKLVEQGNQCLEDGEYEEALKIAAELEELGVTEAYEIAARAHEMLDNLEDAVTVLKRGVEKFPEEWPNWMILGNFLSDLEQNEEAEKAYETALACPDVERDPVILNQAIHAYQMERLDQAMELLSGIKSDYLEVDKREVMIAVLRSKDENERALALAEETLSLPFGIEENGDMLGRIAAVVCKLKLSKGEDKETVRNMAKEALEKYGDAPWLFAIIYEIDDQFSQEAYYYRLLFKVEMPKSKGKKQETKEYFLNYDVVAASEEEALGYVMKLENREFASIALEESEKIEPRPEDTKGVYWRSDVFYYVDEE